MTPDEKPIQYLSDEYIERCRRLTVTERLEVLEEYRLLVPKSVFDARRRQRLREWYGDNIPDGME